MRVIIDIDNDGYRVNILNSGIFPRWFKDHKRANAYIGGLSACYDYFKGKYDLEKFELENKAYDGSIIEKD